jgi:group I intron endonuclease
MTGGIVAIRNIENNKVHIGRTCSLINTRNNFERHVRGLKYPPNQDIREDWNKYGSKKFILEIVEVIEDYTSSKGESRKKYWISKINPDMLYNIKGVIYSESEVNLPQFNFDESIYAY